MPSRYNKSTTSDPHTAKRDRVCRILNDPTCSSLSNRKLAKLAGVDESFVRKMRKMLGAVQQKAVKAQKQGPSRTASSKVSRASVPPAKRKASPKSREDTVGKARSSSRDGRPLPPQKPKKKQNRGA